MEIIHAETINLSSPYIVTQVDDYSVSFVTEHGIRYLVGFTPDIFIFDENGYEFYIINESEPVGQDIKIFNTIVAIIENLFFNSNNSAMVYICSPQNQLQQIRSRLFSIWFHKARVSDTYTLKTYHSFDETDYYYGLIIRKDNPEHDILIKMFFDFFSDF